MTATFLVRRDLVSDFRTALFEISPMARWSDRPKRASAMLQSVSVCVDPSGCARLGLVYVARGIVLLRVFEAESRRHATLDRA